MNFQKLTLKSQEAFQTASEIAGSYNNQGVEPEHLFASLIQDTNGLTSDILAKAGANLNILKIKTNELLEKLPKVAGMTAQTYISQRTNDLVDIALKEANLMKDEYVSTEHLLLAMVQSKSPLGQLIRDQGLNKDSLLKILKDIRGNSTIKDQNPEDKYQALKKYGRVLNDLVRKGKLDPVIGREDEVRRVIQVLSRRTKNNPVLIG
jgi:ATP-dependent Clp protease ATP-binding subunit ClpB